MIEEAVHLFSGEDGGNALGELGSGNQARGIFLQVAFADAIFEKGAERGEFARDGTFLQMVVVEVADEFADGVVGDGVECGRLEAGRGEVGEELAEVLAVIGDGVGRGIFYGAKIFEIFGDSCVHWCAGDWATFPLLIIGQVWAARVGNRGLHLL